jgi:hypothetical protein
VRLNTLASRGRLIRFLLARRAKLFSVLWSREITLSTDRRRNASGESIVWREGCRLGCKMMQGFSWRKRSSRKWT